MPLTDDSDRKSLLLRVRKTLSLVGLWTHHNHKLLERHKDLNSLARVFEIIINRDKRINQARRSQLFGVYKEKLLTQPTVDTIREHRHLRHLLNILEVLDKSYYVFLLSQANFDRIASHSNPSALADLLGQFSDRGLLNQDTLNALVNHPDLRQVCALFIPLIPLEGLPHEGRGVFSGVAEKSLYEVTRLLESKGLLNPRSWSAVICRPDPVKLLYMLNALHRVNLLINDFFTLVVHHNALIGLTEAFVLLNRMGALRHEDYQFVLESSNPRGFAHVVEMQSLQKNNLDEEDEIIGFLELLESHNWVSTSLMSSL